MSLFSKTASSLTQILQFSCLLLFAISSLTSSQGQDSLALQATAEPVEERFLLLDDPVVDNSISLLPSSPLDPTAASNASRPLGGEKGWNYAVTPSQGLVAGQPPKSAQSNPQDFQANPVIRGDRNAPAKVQGFEETPASPLPALRPKAEQKHVSPTVLFSIIGFVLLVASAIIFLSCRSAMGYGKWKLHDRTYPHNRHLGPEYYESLD